ncbi:subunit 2 of anaphase-promoting complex [Chloropicon primus]|uniref:Anaphase-promoting complex subunit 2 n=2 Tax=Chloropicon primus TaxID=1764295 RepID=A0A5B8MWS4_9CHLO|nr:subunit 2 of anaphase-promoting complex [Chloropicon primus]|eukprot:QDZ24626.1 subunit 2 of anaphase-promoting complex [Chloropicon primus]
MVGKVVMDVDPSSSIEPSMEAAKGLEVGERVLVDFERGFKARMVDDGAWRGLGSSDTADEKKRSQVLVETLERVEEVRSGHTEQLRASASAGLSPACGKPSASNAAELQFWLDKIEREARSIVYSVVVVSAPASLSDCVAQFYRQAFREYIDTSEETSSMEVEGPSEQGGDQKGRIEALMGGEWCDRLSFVGQTLNKLGLSHQSENIYTDIVFDHLENWLEERAAGEYTEACLLAAQKYNQGVIMGFLELLLESTSHGFGSEESKNDVVGQWKSRLDFFIYEILGRMRTEEMFDIVVDFPESMQALKDLKVCLEHTNFTDLFIQKFSSQLKKRLLHLGAGTPVILAQYISSIKALNILDPSGILSEIICPLVKDYLKKRKDTTRCTVNMVVYDENLLLVNGGEEEDEGAEGRFHEGGAQSTEDLEDVDLVLKELQWEPVPIQAAQLFNSASVRNTFKTASKDIVAALIDVLGNKEYFIKEYKMILAERLLSKVDDDIDDETRILELLKLRFGANSLRDCEIMLKDMADSKRITSNIRALVQQSQGHSAITQDFSTVILSELFWPPLFEGEVSTPKEVQWMLDTFGSQYKALKAPRTLHWKPHLGVVDLELDFGGEAKEFTVSVAQALIISQFESRVAWESEELAAAAGMAHESLAEKASIWVNSGILKKSVDKGTKKVTYKLVEDVEDQVEKPHAHTKPDLSVMSQEQQMEMNMKVYESYVMGMVTNLESLPLEKIHNMLKMFVLEPVYDKTIQELEAFLAKLVNDNKLTFDGIVYRKKKR